MQATTGWICGISLEVFDVPRSGVYKCSTGICANVANTEGQHEANWCVHLQKYYIIFKLLNDELKTATVSKPNGLHSFLKAF